MVDPDKTMAKPRPQSDVAGIDKMKKGDARSQPQRSSTFASIPPSPLSLLSLTCLSLCSPTADLCSTVSDPLMMVNDPYILPMYMMHQTQEQYKDAVAVGDKHNCKLEDVLLEEADGSFSMGLGLKNTKPILKDEELLALYGVDYWFHKDGTPCFNRDWTPRKMGDASPTALPPPSPLPMPEDATPHQGDHGGGSDNQAVSDMLEELTRALGVDGSTPGALWPDSEGGASPRLQGPSSWPCPGADRGDPPPSDFGFDATLLSNRPHTDGSQLHPQIRGLEGSESLLTSNIPGAGSLVSEIMHSAGSDMFLADLLHDDNPVASEAGEGGGDGCSEGSMVGALSEEPGPGESDGASEVSGGSALNHASEGAKEAAIGGGAICVEDDPMTGGEGGSSTMVTTEGDRSRTIYRDTCSDERYLMLKRHAARSSSRSSSGSRKKKARPPNAPNELLLAAAFRGDLEGIRAALKDGADVNHVRPEDGATPLGAAVQCGHTECVQELMKDEHGFSPAEMMHNAPTELFAMWTASMKLQIEMDKLGYDPSRIYQMMDKFLAAMSTQIQRIGATQWLGERTREAVISDWEAMATAPDHMGSCVSLLKQMSISEERRVDEGGERDNGQGSSRDTRVGDLSAAAEPPAAPADGVDAAASADPATIGNGVQVAPSEISGAGRGLFASGRDSGEPVVEVGRAATPADTAESVGGSGGAAASDAADAAGPASTVAKGSQVAASTLPLATIGNGVVVKESRIADAGRGLFSAGRRFAKGDDITEYSGKRLTSKGPRLGSASYACDPDKYVAAGVDVQTHVACHDRIYIDGIREPEEGSGGGSFANHSESPNAQLAAYDDRLVLRAKQDIKDDDEIFIDYGLGKDVALGESRFVQTTDHDGRRAVEKIRCLPDSQAKEMSSALKALKDASKQASAAQNRSRAAAAKESKQRVEEAKAREAEAKQALEKAEQRVEAAKERDFQLRGDPERWRLLNERGYIKVPYDKHRIDFETSDIADWTGIFNGDDNGRRLQGHKNASGSVTPGIHALEDGVRAFMQSRGWLRTASGEGNKAHLEPKETYAIRDEPGCGKQPRHADSAPRNSYQGQPWGDVPKVAWYATADDSHLHVYPFDQEDEVTLTVKKGTLVIFRGDLGHAGAAHSGLNKDRGHVYIDSPVLRRKKENGLTLTFKF